MLTLTPLAGFALAFVLAWLSTPLVVRLARRIGAVDAKCATKIHAREMPRLGGLAIACAFYVPVLGLALRSNAFSADVYADLGRVWALLGGGGAILALGVYDDLCGARAWHKLAVQIPVAAVAWWAGIRIGGTIAPGVGLGFPAAVSLVVTVVWIVLVVNAVNLIDGLDGLASGVASIALGCMALAAWHRGQFALALFAICLCGSLGGFLVHNFHPAKIFMGDSGSMFLGYVIAVSAVWASQKAATVIGSVLPAVALGLPLLDTSMAVWRRLVRRQPIMTGDLDHIHHRLLALGWSQRRVVLTLYAVSLGFGAISVVLVYLNDPRLHWPLASVALLGALSFARWLGYLGKNAGAALPAPRRAVEPVRARSSKAQLH